MKKFLSVILLTAILIFSRNNFAKAQDVYIGVYPASGLNAYLMTETINVITRGHPHGPIFNCTIRAGRNYYINYKFYITGTTVRDRRTVYENSDGYRGYVFENSPVERAAYEWVRDNWNWH